MNRKFKWVILGMTIVGALSRVHAQQFVITLELVPGQVVTGGASITVEAFIQNNGSDFDILAYQLNLPCNLPGKLGSTGEISSQPASECLSDADCPAGSACNVVTNPNQCNSTAIPNTSNPASGSVPWVYAAVPPNDPVTGCGGVGCQGGLKPISQSSCRFSGTPNSGEGPYILPGGGARRFLGRVSYRVSECAAGAFNVVYEGYSSPCGGSDQNRLVDSSNQCVSDVQFVPLTLTVTTGSCCDGLTCGCDQVTRSCCESGQACPGFNQWHEGRTCDDPSPCIGCGSCLLHGDVRPPYCVVEVTDVLTVLFAYAEADPCHPDKYPEADLAYANGCPLACTSDDDCTHGGICSVAGLCCNSIEVAEVVDILAAYGRQSACPHPCNPGACLFDLDSDSIADCCKDRDYNPGGMSETDCFAQGGQYQGDHVRCNLPYCPP